jgi:hypothetical protein
MPKLSASIRDDVRRIIAMVKAPVARTTLPQVLPNTSKSLVSSEITPFFGEVKGGAALSRSPTPGRDSFMEICCRRYQSAKRFPISLNSCLKEGLHRFCYLIDGKMDTAGAGFERAVESSSSVPRMFSSQGIGFRV